MQTQGDNQADIQAAAEADRNRETQTENGRGTQTGKMAA